LFTKVPNFIQRFFPNIIWKKTTDEKKIWLTFDDGPEEEVTEFILKTLKKLNIKASFFLIGKNIQAFPELTKEIIKEGHIVGNHSFSHLNGFKSKKEEYIYDIELGQKLINEKLVEMGITNKIKIFRPPFGRILPQQIKRLKENYKIVMWDVFSWDFKKNISPEKIYNNVIDNVVEGSILVFHNNKKSLNNLKLILEDTLVKLKDKGFVFSTTW
jgi:peptidoglycan/xylan/chitin deacetylase (PgdA/CDA1 family)